MLSSIPEASRESLEIDVLFVGAGPASLAGSYHLAKLIDRYSKCDVGNAPPDRRVL